MRRRFNQVFFERIVVDGRDEVRGEFTESFVALMANDAADVYFRRSDRAVSPRALTLAQGSRVTTLVGVRGTYSNPQSVEDSRNSTS